MSNRNAAAALLCLAALACRPEEASDPAIPPGRIVRQQPRAARSIAALIPGEARVGEVFQRQPDGRAALAVLGAGFSLGDEIFWAGRHLPTTFGHSRLLTATLPPELLAEPGEIEVTVTNAADPSKATLRATFRLRPRDPPPVPTMS